MTFRQLEYLDMIAKEKSISKAAEKLFISQSALSQQIALMEKEYEIKILDRNQTPIDFTPDGYVFLKAAQDILNIKNLLSQRLQRHKKKSLLIKAVPFYATRVVPFLLSALYQTDPDIEVSLRAEWANEIFKASSEKDALYIHAFDTIPYQDTIPEDPFFAHEVLMYEEIILVLSDQQSMAQNFHITYGHDGWPRIKFTDLEGKTIILPSTSPRLKSIVEKLCKNIPNSHILISDKGFDALLGQLQYTNNIAFLPDTIMRFSNFSSNIQCFKIQGTTVCRPVVVSYSKEQALNTTARQFIDISKDMLSNLVKPPLSSL